MIPKFRLALLAGAIAFGIAATLVAGGCAKKTVRVDSLGHTVGEFARHQGKLSLRGSHPYPQLVLETDEGVAIQIESKGLKGELKSLAGMRVEIEGDAMAEIRETRTPVVNVLRYKMLRLPSGELPIVGTVMIIDGECLLTDRDGRRYWIRGDLASVIREYRGSRLWVVGSKGAAPNPPRGTTPYWVTGYGVIGEPAAGM